MRKKILSVILAVAMITTLLAGCGKNSAVENSNNNKNVTNDETETEEGMSEELS